MSRFDGVRDELYMAVNESGFIDCETLTDYAEKVILPAFIRDKVRSKFDLFFLVNVK